MTVGPVQPERRGNTNQARSSKPENRPAATARQRGEKNPEIRSPRPNHPSKATQQCAFRISDFGFLSVFEPRFSDFPPFHSAKNTWKFKWSCMMDDSCDDLPASERSSAWLERVVWVHEVAGSNPVAPTILFSRPVVQFIHRVVHNFPSPRTLANILFPEQKNTETADRPHRAKF